MMASHLIGWYSHDEPVCPESTNYRHIFKEGFEKAMDNANIANGMQR
jgi:hypothetical protein